MAKPSLCALLLLAAAPAHALDYSGSVELQAPFGQPDRKKDAAPMLIAKLRLPRLVDRLTALVEVRQQLRAGAPYSDEDRALVTVEYPRKGATWFLFWERRYLSGEERVVGGLRVQFKGRM